MTDPDAVPRCTPGGAGATHVFVLDGWDFSFPDVGGRLRGFNLDERVSDRSDVDSCFHPDATSPEPESTPGVDAQVGIVVAELGLDDNVTEGYRNAIDAGEILPLLVVEDVDDLVNDDCIHLGLVYGRLPVGTTAPTLAADGRFEADQTFDVVAEWLEADRTTPKYRFLDGRIEEGVVTASALDLRTLLPFPPDYVVANIPSYGARLRMGITGSGVTDGVVGATLQPDEFVDALAPGLDDVILSTVRAVINEKTDLLLVDDICTCGSIAFVMEGVPAALGATVD